MKKLLFAPLLLLLMSSAVMASEEVVKDDFEDQTAGQQLDALKNWKYIGGWIKPEYGTIVAEGNNKFLRMKGDIFARKQVILADKLTYRFKVRASGGNDEVGGLTFRPPDGKFRYDILFAYKHGYISLVADHAGTREELANGTGLKDNAFQEIVFTVEKEATGVKFTLSVDKTKVFDKEITDDVAMFTEGFTAGFFTYNDKLIDIDSVEFTRGK